MQTNPTIATTSLTGSVEGSYALPANTVKFTVKLREQNIKLRIAWNSGDTSASYLTLPANSSYTVEIKPRGVTFTVYLLAESNATAEIESWQN